MKPKDEILLPVVHHGIVTQVLPYQGGEFYAREGFEIKARGHAHIHMIQACVVPIWVSDPTSKSP